MTNISTPVFENEIKKPVNEYYLVDVGDGLNAKLLKNVESEVLKVGTPFNSSYFNKIRNDLLALKDDNIKTKYYMQINNKQGSEWELEYSTIGFTNVDINYGAPGSKLWQHISMYIPKNTKKLLIKYNVKYDINPHGIPSEVNEIIIGGQTISKKWRYTDNTFWYSDICEIVDITTEQTIVLFNMLDKLTPNFNLRIEVIA